MKTTSSNEGVQSRPRRWRLLSARRLVSVTLVILLIGGGLAYRHFTSEQWLGSFAKRRLEELTGAQVLIDRVQFNLFEGLHLVGVTLAIPESANFDTQDNSLSGRTVFHFGVLFFRLNLLGIVSGQPFVSEIVAEKPELTLVRRVSDGLSNWQAMLRNRKQILPKRPANLPKIRLHDLEVTQYRLDDRGRWGSMPQVIWAEGQPLDGQPKVYDLKITKTVELFDADGKLTHKTEAARLEIDTSTLAVSGNLPTMAFDELILACPPEIQRWFDILDLRGYVRADALDFDPVSGVRATVNLRDASFSVPIDDNDKSLPADQRYIRFEKMAGTISFDGRQARADLTGRFRSSPITIQGKFLHAEQAGDGLDGLGFDLTLTAKNVPLPREDDPSQVSFVRRWKHLRKFVRDYDGIGPVDLGIQLHKSPGAGKGVELVDCVMTVRGVSARFVNFPYRLNELTGVVHFRKDGKVEIKDLAGIHGRGRVIINGQCGGFSSQAVDLEIVGQDIELDADLLGCLSERDQALCRTFGVKALMDLRVRCQRVHAPAGTKNNPFKPTIEVTFKDGSVNFAGFPYPFNKLTGHMRIAEGRFDIDQLSGSRGDARVSINGSVVRSSSKPNRLDLRLSAEDIPLDDNLANALPADARKRYERLEPSGRVDLKGRLFTQPDSEQVKYDLAASLEQASFKMPGSSARLENTRATIRLSPDQLVIESLEGEFNGSTIRLDGRLSLSQSTPVISVHLRCDALKLNNGLCEALPASLHGIWDTFQPSGLVKLDLRYDQRATTSQPEGETVPVVDYTAVIEPTDCEATFSGFPLPLADINGLFIVTPGRVVIDGLTARHGSADLDLSGRVDLLPDKTKVELTINASDVEFSESLRQAVPWRLRRIWNDLKPEGRFDLSLQKLTLTVQPDRDTLWAFEGSADLKNVAMVIGPKLQDLRGQVTAKGGMSPEFWVMGDLSLATVKVDGREAKNVSAKLTRPRGASTVGVKELLGQLYGGIFTGEVEVDYATRVPRYDVTLNARDVSLDEFLNANREVDKKVRGIKGRIEWDLSLSGRLGDPKSRRGGGTILIREAQMFKVPLLLKILQVIHFAIDDDNAFHDGVFTFMVDGEELVLHEIDLRGKAFSMVGAGRVHTPTQKMDLALVIGSPFRLPRLRVITELVEGVARELVEVRVEGTLEKPTFRTEVVRSLKKTLEFILNARRFSPR